MTWAWFEQSWTMRSPSHRPWHSQRVWPMARRALVATRRLLDESEHANYETQFRREIELQAEIRASVDALEGRTAFIEKRKAHFTGRLASRSRLSSFG
jgi:enoyl-CoA hydratase/carnithine racemase